MKNALILGGGSKWGAEFTKKLSETYHVDLITGSYFTHDNVTTHHIDWFGMNEDVLREILFKINDKTFDIIFFNHNSGGGPNEQSYAPGSEYPIDQWHMQNWINCMSTYFIIQNLSNCITEDTKIGWMITGLIDGKEKELWKYAGYANVKSTNVHIMRGFANAHPGIFFALNPIWFQEVIYDLDAETVVKQIENLTAENNGEIITKVEREPWEVQEAIKALARANGEEVVEDTVEEEVEDTVEEVVEDTVEEVEEDITIEEKT